MNSVEKIKEIRIWYRLRPTLYVWRDNKITKSRIGWVYDETYYGGTVFVTGFYIQSTWGFFAIFNWWRFKSFI